MTITAIFGIAGISLASVTQAYKPLSDSRQPPVEEKCIPWPKQMLNQKKSHYSC